MFENSQDILNLAKTIGVVGISVVLVMLVYYLAMMTRQVFLIIKEMRNRTHKLDELLKIAKEKLEHSTSYLLLIGEGVKKLVEVAKSYTEKKKEKK